MTTNKKILIMTVLVAVFIFIGTKKFIYEPRTQQFKHALGVLDEEYEKNRIFFEIKKIRDEIETRSKVMLNSEKDLPWFLGKISEIFNFLHLEVISMEPQPLEKTDFYTLMPVKVRTVCSYHSIGELVSKLENLAKFIDIGYVELNSMTEQDSTKDNSEAAVNKRPISRRSRLDSKGFVLVEATLRLNAIYLH